MAIRPPPPPPPPLAPLPPFAASTPEPDNEPQVMKMLPPAPPPWLELALASLPLTEIVPFRVAAPLMIRFNAPPPAPGPFIGPAVVKPPPVPTATGVATESEATP